MIAASEMDQISGILIMFVYTFSDSQPRSAVCLCLIAVMKLHSRLSANDEMMNNLLLMMKITHYYPYVECILTITFSHYNEH